MLLLGNDKSCRIKGIDTIRLMLHDGMDIILNEVRHVPQLKMNLISLGTFNSKGYTFKAKNDILKIQKGLLVVMKGIKQTSCF